MKILITGGAGFIGSHLAIKLIECGHEIFILDDLSTGSDENLKLIAEKGKVTFCEGSITNEVLVSLMINKVDFIFHLAAVVGVKRVMDEPVNTLTTNVRGTDCVLKLANDKSKPIIVASSSEIYGKNTNLFKENADRVLGDIQDHRWAYACSKSFDEFLTLAYHKEFHLPACVVRFFNTSGPRQSGDFGMVIPRFVKQAINRDPITVFGSGFQSRCFCHVADTVTYLGILMDRLIELDPDVNGQIFNIGNPQNHTSITNLAHTIIEKTKSSSRINFMDPRSFYGDGFEDMKHRFLVNDKVADITDYKCRYSLDDIIDGVIDEFKRQ